MAWDDLPEGWEVKRLAEVAHINMGQSPPGSSYNQEGIGLPLVGGASDLGEVYPSPSKWTSQPSKVAQKGDIIICVRATIGDLNWADREYCLGRGVAGLTAKQGIEPRFLFHYLRSQHAELNAKGTGSTFKQISKSTLAEYPVPFPPLPEQRRIVARIEELTERIDAARRLRAEAVEEAAAILPTALAEVFEEAEGREWETRRLSEVADINMGQSPPGSSYNQEGIGLPLIGGASDLGEVYPSPSRWTSQPSKTSRPGDIIICIRATIGDLNWADKEYCLGRGVAGLTPKQGIEPGFLFHYLRSQHAELNARGTGSTFKQISKSTLTELPVPLPPLDEQRRIVEYLDAVQAKVEAIRRYQEETRVEIEAMTGAVLERAFRGEL